MRRQLGSQTQDIQPTLLQIESAIAERDDQTVAGILTSLKKAQAPVFYQVIIQLWQRNPRHTEQYLGKENLQRMLHF